MNSTTTNWTGVDRVTAALTGARDWLDARGKPAWIIAMILGFVICWPVGLGLLAYMIWSKRMFTCNRHKNPHRHAVHHSSGNSAFDAYREQTLQRLEDEHREFQAFLQKLREARDKAEFDEFMRNRAEPERTPAPVSEV